MRRRTQTTARRGQGGAKTLTSRWRACTPGTPPCPERDVVACVMHAPGQVQLGILAVVQRRVPSPRDHVVHQLPDEDGRRRATAPMRTSSSTPPSFDEDERRTLGGRAARRRQPAAGVARGRRAPAQAPCRRGLSTGKKKHTRRREREKEERGKTVCWFSTIKLELF